MVCTANPPVGVDLMLPHKQRVATAEKVRPQITPIAAARAGFDPTTATEDVIRGEEQM